MRARAARTRRACARNRVTRRSRPLPAAPAALSGVIGVNGCALRALRRRFANLITDVLSLSFSLSLSRLSLAFVFRVHFALVTDEIFARGYEHRGPCDRMMNACAR